MTIGRTLAQVGAYTVFMVIVGALSDAPVYHRLERDEALIRLAFSHFGAPIRECRRLSQAELEALAPNMRKPTDCPRQRLPIRIVFRLDNEPIYQASLPATGLWEDGEATVYERFVVPAGQHRLTLTMRDSAKKEGFDHQLDQQVDIKAMRNLVIGFDPARKQFVIN